MRLRTFLMLSVLVGTVATFRAQAQNIANQQTKVTSTELKVKLVEAASKEPLQYVTVFLLPEKDTVVSNYALSDEAGTVDIKKIKPGNYTLKAEFTGYKPYRSEVSLNAKLVDLGSIELEEDTEMLEAATVTEAGNPISVQGDTITFNATAFHTTENSMLSDLLKKMPGVEVGDDGSVTVNGEKIEKILVGGKTFFANDNSMALENLPAKIIKNVKYVERERRDAQFTGVSSNNDKEKILDIGFKDDYTKGWFGNAALNAGYNLSPASRDNGLADSRKFLWNGRSMLTRYTDNDQAVGIVRGENVGEYGGGNGIHTSANAGVNYNTYAVKGYEIQGDVNYRWNENSNQSRSSRTSFQTDGTNLYSDSNNGSTNSRNSVNMDMEIRKSDNQKYMFEFEPSVSFQDSRNSSSSKSETRNDGGVLNTSVSTSSSTSRSLSTNGRLQLGVRNLGNQRRSLTMTTQYDFGHSGGESFDKSETLFSQSSDNRNLRYDNSSSDMSVRTNINYTEPIAEHWVLQGRMNASFSKSSSDKEAYDAADGSAKEYYSSWSRTNNTNFNGRFLMQWNKERQRMQFGVQLIEQKNVNRVKSRGIETITGEDMWLFNWSPYMNFRAQGESVNFNASYNGSSSQPGGNQISSALNISDPTRISTGNIYLKPSYTHDANLSFRYNNKKTYAFVNMSLGGSLHLNNRVTASWFDAGGIRYSLPVNTNEPGYNANASITYNQPLDKERHLTFSISTNGNYSASTSYQAKGKLAGVDTEKFDYYDFMESFWGDESGSNFYSGKSGFEASRTTSMNISGRVNLRYRLDRFSVSAGFNASNRISKYSLNPSSNLSTWNNRANFELEYETPHSFEINTDVNYTYFKGYTEGYNEPYLIWNAELVKNIGPVAITVRLRDILNQTRNLNRTMSEEYIQDTYTNAMGRYFLVGAAFNFGKMRQQGRRGGRGGGNWRGGGGW